MSFFNIKIGNGSDANKAVFLLGSGVVSESEWQDIQHKLDILMAEPSTEKGIFSMHTEQQPAAVVVEFDKEQTSEASVAQWLKTNGLPLK